jgi:4-hydroxybenzoate polyprenyltransferase
LESSVNGPVAMWRLVPIWVRGLVRTMRPKQWIKNFLVFIPILFDRQISLSNPGRLLVVSLTFVLFCMVAGSVYLLNDAVDVERDRLHPNKRFRPIASGELPIRLAVVVAVIMPIVAIGIALSFSLPLALVLLVYILKQIGYSFYFKNIVLIDVLVLASGYILRVIAGAVVIPVANFSPWLYVCIGMLSLFLAVGKRRQELILLGHGAQDVRATYKDYNMALLDDMLRMVMTSSIITYTLYTVEAKTSLGGPAMMLTLPFAVYGIFRYLYLMHVKGEGGAPDEVVLKDKPLMVTAALFILVAGLIIYGVPYFQKHGILIG